MHRPQISFTETKHYGCVNTDYFSLKMTQVIKSRMSTTGVGVTINKWHSDTPRFPLIR